MIRLYTLGTTQLSTDDGRTHERVLSQPKALTLLSYLAVAYSGTGAFQRRDNLLALFWPEHDEKHARWALNQAVHRLRIELGQSVLASRGPDAISVSRDALWCDAVAFQEACASGDFDAAIQLYRGEFLDGLHIAGCAELSHWLDSQRAQLRQLASRATWSLVDRLVARGEMQEALERARGGVRLVPEDEPGVRRLIALLDATGDRAGAVQAYEDYAGWLRENLGVDPAPETVLAMEKLRATPAASPLTRTSTANVPARQPGAGRAQGPFRVMERVPFRRRMWIVTTAAVLSAFVLLAVKLLWTPDSEPSAVDPRSSIRSIAVLPLTGSRGDPDEDYFVEGMHDALITELSKIGALEVISRTSTMRYQGAAKPPPQVARELNVDAVIEASVLRDGERVRINVRLIHAPTDRHLWAQTFEREMRNVLALQSDVAQAIAREVSVTLSAREQRALDSAPSVEPAAHQAYLKGRYHLGKGTRRSFHTAGDFFRQAIDLDPTYARAYVGLADAYNRSAIQGDQPSRELYPLAKAALRRALELDETLADAYVLQGVVKLRYDWDWEGAERDLRRALELEPNNVRARLGYGTYQLATGHMQEALTHVTEFQRLDPLSAFANGNLAWHLYLNRRYDEAIHRLRLTLDLDHTFGPALALLGQVYAAKGAHREAIESCDTALRVAPDEDEVLTLCGPAYALSGRPAIAVRLLEKLHMRASTRGYVDPYRLASLSAALDGLPGEGERVLQWLTRAYNERSPQLCFLKVNPMFERVSADPRFQEITRRMAFPN